MIRFVLLYMMCLASYYIMVLRLLVDAECCCDCLCHCDCPFLLRIIKITFSIKHTQVHTTHQKLSHSNPSFILIARKSAATKQVSRRVGARGPQLNSTQLDSNPYTFLFLSDFFLSVISLNFLPTYPLIMSVCLSSCLCFDIRCFVK